MSELIRKTKTPKGELRWVYITGEGKEDLNGNNKYSAAVVLDDRIPEHAAYMQEVQEYFNSNKPKNIDSAKSTGIYPLTEKAEDGSKVTVPHMFYLSFKTGTTYQDGSQKVIKTFNSKAVQVDLGEQRIGNGSVGRIAGAMDMYYVKGPKGNVMQAGVTLYLDAIMLTKFIPYTGSSPFEEEDEDGDGWTGADEDTGFEPEAESPAAGKAPPRI